MYDQQYANSIGIQHIHNSNTHATNNYPVTISCVQNACLEYAEMLGAFQNFESFLLSPNILFKNIFESIYSFKNSTKKLSNFFEINVKINYTTFGRGRKKNQFIWSYF